MDAERLAEIQRWGEDLAARPDVELSGAGRTLLSLASALRDGSALEPERTARMRARATAAASADRHELRAAGRGVLLLLDALATKPQRARRRPGRIAVLAGVPLVAIAALLLARHLLAPALTLAGPSDGATLGSQQLAVAHFGARGHVARWTLDGHDVSSAVRAGGGRLALSLLPEGSHTVRVSSRAGFLGASTARRVRFTVDRTPPLIRIARRTVARANTAFLVEGSAPGAVRLSVNGRPASLRGSAFSLRLAQPPPGDELVLVASDSAGNRATRRVQVRVEPRRPPVAVRAVHVTAYGWADDSLRAGVLQLIASHRINAVELDLKDESGIVGFGGTVALAHRIGAARRIYDLAAAVRTLHRKGVRVIGRLVCFRDPILAARAWRDGHRDWVIQTPAGTPYAGYGGFANFASAAVRRYEIAIAVDAARAGVDDVLYDYVRRPDGPISTMRFPGLRGTPESAIVRFLRESRSALAPYGTYLGASVFGIAATRPTEVAQPIRRMAADLDYVAPMVYPSHWARGEYDVANPDADPYAIVQRSLVDFERDVRGTGARVVPWLQDFSLGVTYGPEQVREQISAARHDGIGEFLLWDPAVTYTADGLTADAKTSTASLARPR